MKKSINLIFPLLFLLSGEPAASMQYISRANCFNNESITWDWKQASYPMISVTSMHRWNGLEPDVHSIDDIRHDDNAAKLLIGEKAWACQAAHIGPLLDFMAG